MNTEINRKKMAEINNNIPNFGINSKKVENKTNKEVVQPQLPVEEECVEYQYVQDTGVLGRSQVTCAKCGDIAKSVDEAVALAKNNPTLLNSSEGVFNIMYQDFLASGMEESEAYMRALMGEEEFMELGVAYNK